MLRQALITSLFTFIILIMLLPVSAQVTTVDMELRVNPLLSYGFRDPLYEGEKPGYFTLNRTRLIADYLHTGKLKAQMIIQDRRAWGELNNGDQGELALFRGWAELYFNDYWSVKAGRQGLVYDDQHLFGERNWAGILAHDALKFKYEKKDTKIHLVLSESANRVNEFKRAPLQQNFYKSLQMLWFNKKWAGGKSSLLFVNKGEEKADTTNSYQQTFGTNTTLRLKENLSAKGIYYHQTGRNTSDQKVNAYFWSVQLLWKINDNWEANVGLETISGADVSDQSINETDRGFDRHFALLHAHLGYMDLLYVLRDPVFGIEDYYVKLSYKINDQWSVRNHVHTFLTEKDAYSIEDTNFSNQLTSLVGVENDFQLRFNRNDWASVVLGHSVMFGTETMDEIFGGRPIDKMHYYYIVLSVRPRLFQFDWSKKND
ncbi:MAG: hypothetical protein WBA74_17370 [Cyclobacteriaceae bacterium]